MNLPEPDHFYYSDDDHRSVRKPLPLFTAAQMIEFRNATLEEAAEYVDRNLMSCREYADAIRNLKD